MDVSVRELSLGQMAFLRRERKTRGLRQVAAPKTRPPPPGAAPSPHPERLWSGSTAVAGVRQADGLASWEMDHKCGRVDPAPGNTAYRVRASASR